MALFFLMVLNTQAAFSIENKYINLFQNWDQETRFDMYSENEGSQIMPLQWFLNLKVPGTKRYLKNEIYKIGFIEPDHDYKASGRNPHNLPLGFTVDSNPKTTPLYGEKEWVGVNCTACHTGIIKIKNQDVLIEGGQGLFDFQAFEKMIIASADYLLKKDAEKDLAIFFKNLSRDKKTAHTSIASLRGALSKFVEEFTRTMEKSHFYFDKNNKEVPYGPGRIDGLGIPTSSLICHLTDRLTAPELEPVVNVPENCETTLPGSSLPHLWGMTRLNYVQWFGHIYQKAALGRNMGQAAGSFAKNWAESSNGKIRYYSTVNPSGVFALESQYPRLQPPLWKDLVFFGLGEPISKERLKRGRKLFMKNCNSCHSTNPEKDKNGFWKVFVDHGNTGQTDAIMIDTDYARRAKVTQPIMDKFNKIEFENGTASGFQMLNAIGGDLIKNLAIKDPGLWTGTLLALLNLTPQPLKGYKARPLDGVVFTAPYLHNASVPTIYDLLSPAKERPQTFHVGCRKYDTEKFGYTCTQNDKNAFLFDTSKEGNGNQGHEYGLDDFASEDKKLNHENKLALIEFLKYIEEPQEGSKDEAVLKEQALWEQALKDAL